MAQLLVSLFFFCCLYSRLSIISGLHSTSGGASDSDDGFEAAIIEPPGALTEAVEGVQVTLKCRASGKPRPMVKWIKDGQVLDDLSIYNKISSVETDGNLIINGTTIADTGNYTCQAMNRYAAQFASGWLDIKRRTTITTPPDDKILEVGESVTLHCSASGDPSLKVKIEWKHGSEPVQLSERIVQNYDNSLTISRLNEMDNNKYTCTARTRLDHVEASVEQLVRDVPNPPVNVRVQCHERSATVSWEPNGDNRDPIVAYTISYTATFQFQDGVQKYEYLQGDISPADLSRSVAPSHTGMNYTFRVIARNNFGPSNVSAPAHDTCTTLPDVPHKNQGDKDRPTRTSDNPDKP